MFASLLAIVSLTASCLLGTSLAQTTESYYKEVYPEVDLTGNLSNHLFFALVQSFGVEFNGSGNIAGVKVAVDRINADSSVLPNHVLHYTLTDSQVRYSVYCIVPTRVKHHGQTILVANHVQACIIFLPPDQCPNCSQYIET